MCASEDELKIHFWEEFNNFPTVFEVDYCRLQTFRPMSDLAMFKTGALIFPMISIHR